MKTHNWRPDLYPGDIVLYRGKGLLKWLWRAFLGTQWDHAEIMGDNKLYGMTFKGLQIRQNWRSIYRMDVVVLRPDIGIVSQLTPQTFKENYAEVHGDFIKSLKKTENENLQFNYFLRAFDRFHLPNILPKSWVTCDAYIHRIYDEVLPGWLNVNDLLHNYDEDDQVIEAYALTKIFDYRGKD